MAVQHLDLVAEPEHLLQLGDPLAELVFAGEHGARGYAADRFPAPFPNEPAARASNGGAMPPDLSVMAKARHHGPQYIYSLCEAGPRVATLRDGEWSSRNFGTC